MLYISHRSRTLRFSPHLKFLKNARSLLKIEGNRILFLGTLPICPSAVGGAKQLTLIIYGVPVESAPLTPSEGSQVSNARAFICPPVKSVIIVQTVGEVCVDPAGQVCPAVMVAVPLVKLTAKFLGLPLAYEVVPENCQLSKIARTNPLFQTLLSLGRSQI